MRNIWIWTAMVFGMLCLGGCPRPDTQQLEWPYGAIFEYKENAIKLEVDADRELNRYQGDANSLHLCMYQLRNPNELNRLSNNEDGLYQLLSVNCGFSDGSVANATPMTVQPGEKETYIYNRAEDARYVAFVAGYYALERERIIRLVRVPVVLVKKSTGFFSSTQVPKVPNMQVKLKLGPEQITSIDVIPGR